MDKHLSLSSLIVLTPRRGGLLAGQHNTVDVLVRIQAPDAPEGHTAVRPPQAIALVIDRSGSMDKHLSLSSLIVLTPRRAGLLAGQNNTVDVLVRIQTPDAPEGHTSVRPPQAIALVIDCSGSMEGRPLAEARRCAEYVVG